MTTYSAKKSTRTILSFPVFITSASKVLASTELKIAACRGVAEKARLEGLAMDLSNEVRRDESIWMGVEFGRATPLGNRNRVLTYFYLYFLSVPYRCLTWTGMGV